MSSIRYVIGDATAPVGKGPKIIAHICNDAGKWGKGFVLAVSKRWLAPEATYLRAFRDRRPPRLSDYQIVPVAPDLWVANLIAQHGTGSIDGVPPIRYYSLGDTLVWLAEEAKLRGASVHMPRIGCGLAGGKWSKVEPIIQQQLCARGIDVTVYEQQGTT